MTQPCWPARPPGIAFGADYNPEQWPLDVQKADLDLMAEAGVNFVTLGVFAWASLQPSPERFEWEWLDRVMDGMAERAIAVDLATPSAAPPAWLSRAHPEMLPIDADGRRLWYGSRQAICPSSPAWRQAATAMARRLAERYKDHPALVMWHVHNEYGCHVPACYCDVSAAAFRTWLRGRYGELEALNEAWGTRFWGQRYSDWEEVIPPRATPSFSNPTQKLDWARFCSDELLDCFRAERDVLVAVAPGVPVTTNFMSLFRPLDYQAWAAEVDVVSNDHYVLGHLEDPEAHLAFSADLVRSLAGGRPWWLMEHSPSAVNWQPVNRAKAPGQMTCHSLTHVARGADAVGFFQWRASLAGSEKYHSAMVPHAGTDSKVWREVVALGSKLRDLTEVAGSQVEAEVALLHSWESWWAAEGPAIPSNLIDVAGHLRSWHAELRKRAVSADVVSPRADLGRYRLLIAPNLYLISPGEVARLEDFVASGGTLVVSYWSGIADAFDHVLPGGYPGALRDLLGVRTEEFFPLGPGEALELSNGWTGTRWSELMRAEGADVVAHFASGPLAGVAAITRRELGKGRAYYLATHLEGPSLASMVSLVVGLAGVAPVAQVPPGVDATRRRAKGKSWLFLVNNRSEPAKVEAYGEDLLCGERRDGSFWLGAYSCAVIREQGG